jgi:5-formyltetrahydrofolate cyclo-ligase
MLPDMASKEGLRGHFKDLRGTIAPREHAEASAEIQRRLEAFCVSRRIRKIGAFWPLGSEVDLRPLVTARSDWLWYFPRVVSTAPPRLAWGTEPLQEGLWGLMEPEISQHFTPPVELLLVPGLAFDEEGYRLGYGKGFYDALLDHLDDRMPSLGVGFGFQRVQLLPREPRDLPVQGLLTEQGLVWFRQEEPDC